MKFPIGDKEYVGLRGQRCPICGSKRLDTASNMETDAGLAWQSILCLECHSIWRDWYELSGYTLIEVPDDAGFVEIA